MKYLIVITFTIFILSSCDDAFLNSGDTIRKEYTLEDFTELYIEDVFDIFLIQDTICKIELEASKNNKKNKR